MKHVLVIYEGAADAPCDELEGATPLELAHNLNASQLVKRGCAGALQWPREEKFLRTEHALALLLGIRPGEARNLRRGPVEAMGTSMDPSRWTYAYRGNFITTYGNSISTSRVDGLTMDEATELTKDITAHLDGHVFMEITGESRVSVMLDRLQGNVDPGEFPSVGLEFDDEAMGNDRLDFMRSSAKTLAHHAINDVRVDLGENPASRLWLWGGGGQTSVGRPFIGAPLKAAMISHSPLARGMARLCGMKHIELGDLWSVIQKPKLIERNELANCISGHDLTVVYVEAPLEGGQFGTPAEKTKNLDRLDIHLMSRIADAVAAVPNARMMAVALPEDGVDRASTPVFMTGSRVKPDATERWDEASCAGGNLGVVPAHRCISLLVGE